MVQRLVAIGRGQAANLDLQHSICGLGVTGNVDQARGVAGTDRAIIEQRNADRPASSQNLVCGNLHRAADESAASREFGQIKYHRRGRRQRHDPHGRRRVVKSRLGAGTTRRPERICRVEIVRANQQFFVIGLGYQNGLRRAKNRIGRQQHPGLKRLEPEGISNQAGQFLQSRHRQPTPRSQERACRRARGGGGAPTARPSDDPPRTPRAPALCAVRWSIARPDGECPFGWFEDSAWRQGNPGPEPTKNDRSDGRKHGAVAAAQRQGPVAHQQQHERGVQPDRSAQDVTTCYECI